MPVPAEMTLSVAVTEVLAACGQRDDSVANPLFVADAISAINRACRILQRDAQWLAQARTQLVNLVSGQRRVELPTDGLIGAITELRWQTGGTIGWRSIPQAGIDSRNAQIDAIPLNWDISPTQGITATTKLAGGTAYSGSPVVTVTGGSREPGGTDPVLTATVASGVITQLNVISCGTGWIVAPTIVITDGTGSGASYTATLGAVQALELWPGSTDTATLQILYRTQAYTLTQDADLLPFDSEAVIGKAALLVAIAKALPMASALGTMHDLYLARAKSQLRPGAQMSLSSWRKDGWDLNQVTTQ